MHLFRRDTHPVLAVLAIALGSALAACGAEPRSGVVTAPPTGGVAPTAEPAPRSTSVPSTSPPEQVAILGVYTAVKAYPACGNETLEHLGVTWYPLVHVGSEPIDGNLRSRVDQVLAVEREASPIQGLQGFARVAPPGPGDDVGTLVVWADGVARWTSDSGQLDVWMIDDVIEYSWVC